MPEINVKIVSIDLSLKFQDQGGGYFPKKASFQSFTSKNTFCSFCSERGLNKYLDFIKSIDYIISMHNAYPSIWIHFLLSS